jgi:cytosine/adenosine deaminase-related metal-dependent hydrolase
MSIGSRQLRARWVFPVDQPPLENGVVEVLGNEIVAVRPYRSGDAVEDLGDVALLPGLVNAHTHLEFSHLTKPLGQPRMAFPDWIRLVIEYRRTVGQTSSSARDAVAAGLAESHACGVALLGEIATYEQPHPSDQPEQVVFAELLGLKVERIEPLWQRAQQVVADAGSVCHGLSPHAPYTVHPELLVRVCELSAEKQFPVAMHLAESLEEIEFLQAGSGRMVELLQEFNAFARVVPRGTRPLEYLQQLAGAWKSLVIHGNFLSPDEIEFAGQRSERMSIVYCPRTHAYFNAGDYPLAEMLAANVNVCLGTDSRATNPDLSLFEEMRFVAQRHPRVTPEGVLYLGTQAGADALGQGDRYGSITPGKSARLTKVALKSFHAVDPHELLFEAGTGSSLLD